MAISKNREEVRLNSSDNFKVNDGSGWITLGHILSGKLSYSAESQEVVYANGDSEDFRGKRKGTLLIVLAQVSKEILDKIDELDGKPLKLYYPNGTAYNGNAGALRALEFGIPEARIVPKTELEMKGQSHQNIPLEFSLSPYDTGNAVVNTFTGLPSDAEAYESTPGTNTTGTNPFWVTFETVV